MDNPQTILVGVSAFFGAISAVAASAWWLRGYFASMEERIDAKIDATKELLMSKIDDHEKMDIERFSKQELALMRIEMKQQSEGKPLYGI